MSSALKSWTIWLIFLSSVIDTKASEWTFPTIEKIKTEVARALWKMDLSKNKAIANSIERYCKSTHLQTPCEIEKIKIAFSLPGHISITYKKWNSEYEIHPQFLKEEIKNVKFWELNF
jgi:hypothetical protein